MTTRILRCRAVLLSVLLACAISASAEIEVSVTISGSPEELLPLLQHLKDLGIGGGTPAQDPLKVEIQSDVIATEPPPAPELPAAAPAPEPVKPPMAIMSTTAQPSSVTAGDALQIAVAVCDPDGKIDTIGVSIKELGVSEDLYDDASHSDATANDGTWSTSVTIPGTAPAKEYSVQITAYDKNGETVTTADDDGTRKPLEAQVAVTVAAK